jgi:DNA polymerase-1
MITNRVHNNRLFSEIWILGARTGRTTSKNSALQNVTKPIRHVFRAEPGEVLIGIDIDRAEVALAALASGDEILSQDLRAGDLYMAQARRVHGPTASQEHRTAFKTAMLAIFFGQGHTATARKLGITEEAVSQMVGAMRSRWTKLFALVESTKTAVQHGYNRHTISGRALPALTPSESYIGFNHLTQGGSADLFNAGCIRVADALGAALYGGGRREGSKHLWLPIHDELICSVPADRAEEMLQVLETAMSTEINGVRIGGTAKLLGLAWRKTD